jgi:hypothetical protein
MTTSRKPLQARTQSARIIDYLATGKPLTPLLALRRWGVFRLSGRIFELREDGHDIRTERVTRRGKTFASYTLRGRH